MSKHTPGPWGQSKPKYDGAQRFIFERSTRRIIGWVLGDHQANAHLIASAPTLKAESERLKEINAELLAHLEALIPVLESARKGISAMETKILIAKAKGEDA